MHPKQLPLPAQELTRKLVASHAKHHADPAPCLVQFAPCHRGRLAPQPSTLALLSLLVSLLPS
eukprot:9355326-Alexandrium_andersonii.AAC.1